MGSSPGDLPNPGIKPRYPTLQADCLPSEPLGKPMNTGKGSQSSQGDLPHPGIKLGSPALAGRFLNTSATWDSACCCRCKVTSVVSNSVQPQRRQPIRLPRPWDSPGKNTGVGCHFLLQRMKGKSESEVAQSCPTPSDPMDCSPPGSSVHGIFQARVLEWGAIAFPQFLL